MIFKLKKQEGKKCYLVKCGSHIFNAIDTLINWSPSASVRQVTWIAGRHWDHTRYIIPRTRVRKWQEFVANMGLKMGPSLLAAAEFLPTLARVNLQDQSLSKWTNMAWGVVCLYVSKRIPFSYNQYPIEMFQMYLSLCLVLADFTEHMWDLLNRNCIAHMPNVEYIQKKSCIAWVSFPLAPKSEMSVKVNSTV